MSWVIAGIALLFYVMENDYYGWNRHPQSDAELICDGIFLLILSVALAARRGPTSSGVRDE